MGYRILEVRKIASILQQSDSTFRRIQMCPWVEAIIFLYKFFLQRQITLNTFSELSNEPIELCVYLFT